MLQVPFFICRYLLLNIQVPFSTRQQAIHGTVLFTPDLLTPHTVFTSLPATVSVFCNVSTHFFFPCAHSVVASSTTCHLNRRKLSTYRETRPPSWENGTWQVPSQLSHSDYFNITCTLKRVFVRSSSGVRDPVNGPSLLGNRNKSRNTKRNIDQIWL